MKRTVIQIILSFTFLAIVVFVNFPIEIQNKSAEIVIEHAVLLLGLTMIFFCYKAGRKIKRPFNWISHIVNSLFLLIIGYTFLWKIMFDFSGNYPVWTDKKIYINQADTNEVIVGQEYRISGSMIDWRERKVKIIMSGIRLTRPVSTNTLNGRWRYINREYESSIKDTIANFKNGKMVVQ